MGLYLVVPRVTQRDRGPLALLGALAYLGGASEPSAVAGYWGVTLRTVRRWLSQAETRGWSAGCASTPRGQEAWRAARKERVPAELRGHMPLARLAIWGRLRRRRAFGTRLLALDCRCSRRTVQRAFRTVCFVTIPNVLDAFRTPWRLALVLCGQNVAPPQPPPSETSLSTLRSPLNDRPEGPLRGPPGSLEDMIHDAASGLALPKLPDCHER